MSQAAKRIPNCAGGLNAGLHPTVIADNEFSKLENYYVKGDSIYRRPGSRRLTSAAISGVRSMYSYRNSADQFEMIVAGDGLYAVVNSTGYVAPTAISCRYGTPFTGSTKRPFFSQINGICHMSDPVGGPLRRLTEGFYEDAGIVAPLAGCTIADGGAGVMSAANYIVVYRYKNSATGDVSDYSPVSNILALGANKQVAVSGLVASVLPQVDTIEIGITPPGVSNGFLSAVEVPNGTTTATINLTVSSLGSYFVNTAGLPPTDVRAHCLFDDRTFTTDGKFVFYSHYLQYEVFDTTNDRIPVLSNDGHEINVLYPWGNKLVAGKPNYVVYFTPTGTGTYAPTVLSDKYGVRSPHAMRASENVLIWFDGLRFQRSDSGSTPRDISGIRIKPYLDAIPGGSIDDLSAEIIPDRDIYVVTVPQNDGTTVMLAYNYKVEAWSLFSFPVSNPSYVIEAYDENDNRFIVAALNNGYLFEIFDRTKSADDNTSGGTVSIPYIFRHKAFTPGDDPTLATWLLDANLLTTNTGEVLSLKVFEDDKTTPTHTINAYCYSDEGKGWKKFPLSTVPRSSGAGYVAVQGEALTSIGQPETFRISGALFNFIYRPQPNSPAPYVAVP